MKKNLLFVFGLVVGALVLSSSLMPARAIFMSPSDFEQNHFDIELDFWLNTTGTLTSPASVESTNFQLLHARYSFSTRATLAAIYGYDIVSSVDFFLAERLTNFYAQDCYSYLSFSKSTGKPIVTVVSILGDDNPGEYWDMGGGSTSELFMPITEQDFVDEGASTTYLMNFTKAYDDTTEPTLTLDSQNILSKDTSTQYLGVKYHASESMSINDYATVICEMNDVTLYDIANASTICWLMQDSIDHDEINNVAIDFEVQSSSTTGLHVNTGILKRYSFSLLKRVRDKIYSTTSTLQRNLFIRIPTSRVISGIRSVPSAAGYYRYDQIGSYWYSKKLGVRAIAGSIKDTALKFFGTIFSNTGLTIMAFVYAGIGIVRLRKGKKFLWKPWKGKWLKQ
ncbi:MAG: hypothetical protein ACTSYG_07325 [Candidatus Heimdallarchaeota archaeon]